MIKKWFIRELSVAILFLTTRALIAEKEQMK
jgi:hypothetical protein